MGSFCQYEFIRFISAALCCIIINNNNLCFGNLAVFYSGTINQSLLTLGRVITSLVERAPHIPYRYVGMCG